MRTHTTDLNCLGETTRPASDCGFCIKCEGPNDRPEERDLCCCCYRSRNITTHNMSNNETVATGMSLETDGTYTVLTRTESKNLKTKAGAVRWLAKRGYNENGTRKGS